jgi:hypothetical protein
VAALVRPVFATIAAMRFWRHGLWPAGEFRFVEADLPSGFVRLQRR